MKKVLLLLLIATCATLNAQDYLEDDKPITDRFPIFIGVYPSLSLPSLDFGDQVSNVGLGGGLEFLVNLDQTPFYAGLSANIANYGHESLDFVDSDGFELTWKTNSSLWDTHLLLQFEPPFKYNFQPYISAKIGFNHFFTVTRLIDNSTEDTETLERYVDDNSWGLSYGATLGTLIPFDKDWRYMLNARVSYLRGTNVSYYAKQNSFTLNGDTLSAFNLEESRIDLFRIEVGVLVYLR